MNPFRLLRQLHRDIVAAISKWLVTREIVQVLRVAHAQELAETPGEMWPFVQQKHIEQIQAVRDGKLDIIDRRSWAYPYLPEALHRLNQPILKNTPYNLRRFSETPIARRCINLIKNTVVSLDWTVEVVPEEDDNAEREKRIQIATNSLRRPNNVDSYRTFMEAVTEDIICGGYGCIEPRLTPYYKRPFKMWPVDGSTIRVYADWTESTPERPRFAQMTGLKGERGIVAFLANELIYIKDNPRSNTPFGLGKMEVAFNSLNAFLGVQDMAAKAGADQVHKNWLWWKTTLPPGQLQTVRRHIQNELEGQQKISLMAGLPKPDVIDVKSVLPADLLLEWQELLVKIICNAFDISPMSLGLDSRAMGRGGTAAEAMNMADFRNAIVPMAKRLQDALTRDLIQGFLGWTDLQFSFIGLDDPDTQTKIAIQQRQWMMSALTADEVRDDQGRPPIPGGWGKLTMFQQQLILAQVQSQAKSGGASGGSGGGQGAGQSPGSGGSGVGMPGGGGGGNLPSAGAGGGSMTGAALGMMFQAGDVAQMSPEDVALWQQLGYLPNTQDLGQQMEQAQPGVLETVSQELQDFFKMAEDIDDDDSLDPQKVTNKDEKEQQRKFTDADRSPTLIEQMYQDRGMWKGQNNLLPGVTQSKQPGARGKYPRSTGGIRPGWWR